MGKRNIERALELFHERHSDIAIELNVTRRPYSFNGDVVLDRGPKTWLWRDGLCIYIRGQLLQVLRQVGINEDDWRSFGTVAGMQAVLDSGDDRIPRALAMATKAIWGIDLDIEDVFAKMKEAEASGATGQRTRGAVVLALDRVFGASAPEFMTRLGASVKHNPIYFNTDVEFEFQPVDSQRMLQWAARYGKQEEVVNVLAHLHFEKQESATKRSTLFKAVEAVDLDVDAFREFLDSDDMVDHVWKSYGDTIKKHEIHSIPLFIFNGPLTNGGPFRDGSDSAVKIHGSANCDEFVAALERIFEKSQAVLKDTPVASVGQPEATTKGYTMARKESIRSAKNGLKKGFLL